jgi:hypothetical protein
MMKGFETVGSLRRLQVDLPSIARLSRSFRLKQLQVELQRTTKISSIACDDSSCTLSNNSAFKQLQTFDLTANFQPNHTSILSNPLNQQPFSLSPKQSTEILSPP